MENRFKEFVEKSDPDKIERLVNKLELEEDRELENIIVDLSSLII